MNSIEQFQSMVKKVEVLREANIRAKAKLEEAYKELKEMGFDSLPKAEAALDELEEVIDNLSDEIYAKVELWEEKWGKMFLDSRTNSISSRGKKSETSSTPKQSRKKK